MSSGCFGGVGPGAAYLCSTTSVRPLDSSTTSRVYFSGPVSLVFSFTVVGRRRVMASTRGSRYTVAFSGTSFVSSKKWSCFLDGHFAILLVFTLTSSFFYRSVILFLLGSSIGSYMVLVGISSMWGSYVFSKDTVTLWGTGSSSIGPGFSPSLYTSHGDFTVLVGSSVASSFMV